MVVTVPRGAEDRLLAFLSDIAHLGAGDDGNWLIHVKILCHRRRGSTFRRVYVWPGRSIALAGYEVAEFAAAATARGLRLRISDHPAGTRAPQDSPDGDEARVEQEDAEDTPTSRPVAAES
ncbi:hypothetical protein [Microbacterium enclense]|uniref:hypothetical protein n=1 Tax=Microbacterium enclense TaxID=993073 RepID=UPI003F7D5A92